MLKRLKQLKFDFFDELSKKDKIVFVFCFFLGSLCSALLMPFFDELLEFQSASNSNQPVIGKIVYKNNDIQIKPHQELIWFKAKKDQSVRTGDTVFSGNQSLTKIEINNSNKIVLGENSMILFQVMQEEKIANLKDGNFRLSVDGNVKVAINGRIAEIKGDNSEIQVFVAKDKAPQVKLLTGKAVLTEENTQAVELVEGVATQMTKQEEPAPKLAEAPVLDKNSKSNPYYWKLFDLFEQQNTQFIERDYPTATINHNKIISWSHESDSANFEVEIAGQMDFSNKLTYKTSDSKFELNRLFAGKNYWRVREGSNNWSEIADFEINTSFLTRMTPQVYVQNRKLALIDAAVTANLKLKSNNDAVSFLIQSSDSSSFKRKESLTSLSSNKEVNLVFNKTGKYYYRFKAINESQQLSDWSETIEFDVYSPDIPDAPQLDLAKTKVFLSEDVSATWRSKGFKTYIEIRDNLDRIVKVFEQSMFSTKLESIGNYTATAWAIDKYGRRSEPSAPVNIQVMQDPSVLLDRNIASENTDTQIFTNNTIYLNEGYKASHVSVNGFLWSMFSSQQLASNGSSQSTTGVGIQAVHWNGSHGYEGSYKRAVASSGQYGSLSNLEMRYHYRFFGAFPKNIARELQISLLTGYEMYRNSGGLVYSSKYDLLKLGANAYFPWLTNWSGGGEFVFGYGFDGSTKYELSGKVNYYLSQTWSLGFGYKIHLFEAGSTASSANGVLPYREGYTEGFSLLNYEY